MLSPRPETQEDTCDTIQTSQEQYGPTVAEADSLGSVDQFLESYHFPFTIEPTPFSDRPPLNLQQESPVDSVLRSTLEASMNESSSSFRSLLSPSISDTPIGVILAWQRQLQGTLPSLQTLYSDERLNNFLSPPDSQSTCSTPLTASVSRTIPVTAEQNPLGFALEKPLYLLSHCPG